MPVGSRQKNVRYYEWRVELRAKNNRERVGVSLTKGIGKSYLVIVLVDR